MAAEVDIRGEVFTARYRPERSAAVAGVGCAVVLLGLTVFGVVETVQSRSLVALLGLPCTALFALSFAVLGLTRGITTVQRDAALVITERRFLGVVIRRDVLPYGRAQKVVIDTLGRDRRPFSLVSVLGDKRQAEIISEYDAREARAFAQRLGDHLGVLVEERVEEGGSIVHLPETPEA